MLKKLLIAHMGRANDKTKVYLQNIEVQSGSDRLTVCFRELEKSLSGAWIALPKLQTTGPSHLGAILSSKLETLDDFSDCGYPTSR